MHASNPRPAGSHRTIRLAAVYSTYPVKTQKMGLKNNAELVQYAIEHHLLP